MSDTPRPPVQALSAREAGLPVDETLYEGVPGHLLVPLQDWTRQYLAGRLAHRVAATLRWQLGILPDTWGRSAGDELADCTGSKLLDVVDLALQLDERLHVEIAAIGQEENDAARIAFTQFAGIPSWLFPDHRWPSSSTRASAVEDLDQLLLDGGSAYKVRWWVPTTLMRRVDPTISDAFERTLIAAPPTAAEHLRDAWRHVYGLRPDPTAAYRQAVRAVEEIACPQVLPNDDGATLGKVVAHLRQGGHKWRFVLVDRAGQDTVDPLVGLLERLWTGQVSRHGGGQNSREQTQPEGEAAVHLAVTAVQLLTAGALIRRDTP